jgi:phosphate transport system protein
METAERFVRHFQEELDQLKARLLEMGGLAEEQVRLATQGFVERDEAIIERSLRGDAPINALHIEIDNRAFTLLALFQPLAADLRTIVSAVKINTDLERVGDLAVNIAEVARRYASHPMPTLMVDISQMAALAQSMLRDALDAFVRGDMVLAQRVLDEDDRLDALKTETFRDLLSFMLKTPAGIEPALDLILVSRHLERIGDHATNIAEDVIFIVSARDIRHHANENTERRLRVE